MNFKTGFKLIVSVKTELLGPMKKGVVELRRYVNPGVDLSKVFSLH